jgi:hypothetical protein
MQYTPELKFGFLENLKISFYGNPVKVVVKKIDDLTTKLEKAKLDQASDLAEDFIEEKHFGVYVNPELKQIFRDYQDARIKFIEGQIIQWHKFLQESKTNK